MASHLAESLPPVHRLAKQIGCKSGREALTAGAQIYINFLSLTRRSGWLQGHISKQAERSATKAAQARAALETAAARYLAFMDIRSEYPEAVPTRAPAFTKPFTRS